MFRVFQHRTSSTHFIELFADGMLCFVAALLSAITLRHPGPGAGALAQAITPAILLTALAFIYLIPAVVAFGFARRFLVQTFSGGVKG